LGRIRTIKPEFYQHEGLFDLEQETGLPLRVAYSGLWTQCDREGRFRWEPEEIKLDCLPFDDVDFSRVLDALATRGFIVKYTSGNRDYGVIPSFLDHQVINNRESKSTLPQQPLDASSTREPRVTDLHVHTQGEGKGREGKGREEDTSLRSENVSCETSKPPLVESPKGLSEKYYFESGVIRLNEKDFEKWEKSFPSLDLRAELIGLTQWANEHGDKWFFPVSGALSKRNREQKIKLEHARVGGSERHGPNDPLAGII